MIERVWKINKTKGLLKSIKKRKLWASSAPQIIQAINRKAVMRSAKAFIKAALGKLKAAYVQNYKRA